MKRWTIRLITLVLVLGFIVGCAAKKEVTISADSDSNTETTEAIAQTKAPAQEPQKTVEETAEPADEQEYVMTPGELVEIEGLELSNVTFGDCKGGGLYGYPYDCDIVYSINNVINGTVQLKSSPTDMLTFSCKLILDTAATVNIQMRVYEQGEQVVIGDYDVELPAGENDFIAFIKLPHVVPDSFRIEMWYNGGPALAVGF